MLNRNDTLEPVRISGRRRWLMWWWRSEEGTLWVCTRTDPVYVTCQSRVLICRVLFCLNHFTCSSIKNGRMFIIKGYRKESLVNGPGWAMKEKMLVLPMILMMTKRWRRSVSMNGSSQGSFSFQEATALVSFYYCWDRRVHVVIKRRIKSSHYQFKLFSSPPEDVSAMKIFSRWLKWGGWCEWYLLRPPQDIVNDVMHLLIKVLVADDDSFMIEFLIKLSHRVAMALNYETVTFMRSESGRRW